MQSVPLVAVVDGQGSLSYISRRDLLGKLQGRWLVMLLLVVYSEPLSSVGCISKFADVTSAVGSGTLNALTLFVPDNLPYQCLLCIAGGKDASNMYMWAEPPINDSCSAVRSVGLTNMLVDNHADIAGGAVYATDLASLNFTCPNGSAWDDTTGCLAWSGNTVSLVG